MTSKCKRDEGGSQDQSKFSRHLKSGFKQVFSSRDRSRSPAGTSSSSRVLPSVSQHSTAGPASTTASKLELTAPRLPEHCRPDPHIQERNSDSPESQTGNPSLPQIGAQPSSDALDELGGGKAYDGPPVSITVVAAGPPEPPSPTNTRQHYWERIIYSLPPAEFMLFEELLQKRLSSSELMKEFFRTAENHLIGCLKNQWIVRVGGNYIPLRSIVAKIVDFAEKFRDIGKIASQYDPGCVALGGILLNFSKHICLGLQEISRLIMDGAVYEKLYMPVTDFLLHSTLDRFYESLEGMYFASMLYMMLAIRILKNNSMKRFMGSLWYQDDLTEGLKLVLKAEADFRKVVELVESEVKIIRAEKNLDHFRELRDELFHIRNDEKIKDMAIYVEGQKRIEVLTWLSTVHYPNHHALAKKDHVQGTGEWLLKHEKFLRWQESSGSTCLWLKGNAGTGKTKLASLVIETLMQQRNQKGNTEAFAYFYCNRGDPERRNPEVIMSTLVKQLASLSPGGPLQKVILQEYETRKATTGQSSPLNLMDSYRLAITLCDIYPGSLIIIDALDECEPETRHELLNCLYDLAANSSSLVKIFVTSRLDSDIAAIFQPKNIPTIEFEAGAKRDKEVEKIVRGKVEEAVTQRGLLKGKLSLEEMVEFKLQMIDILRTRAEGMPLWITHQISNICSTNRRKFQTRGQVLDALKAFPEGLKDTYDFMLHDILKNPHDISNAVAIAAFQWVMTAVRPLTPDELFGAIDLVSYPAIGPEEALSLQHILELCNNLLVHDDNQGVVRFYHLSVREYLENQEFPSNHDVMESPLSLLAQIDGFNAGHFTSSALVRPLNTPRLQAFLRYTAWNWPAHFRPDSQSPGLQTFLRNHDAYCAWLLSLGYVSGHPSGLYAVSRHDYMDLADADANDPMLAVVCWGLYELVKLFFHADITYISRKTVIRKALTIGAKRGHEQIVRFLVEKGANADNAGALQWAAKKGHEQIVRFLVEKGANADNADALKLAARKGHEGIVRFLVEKRTTVDAVDTLDGAAHARHSSGDEP